SWLSYMNPHRLAWGFAYTMPFAQIVAITLLGAMLFTRDKISMPRNTLVVVWALFLLWLTICTLFAVYPENAFMQLEIVLKIQLITLVTLLMMNSLERVNQLIWVIVFSIGFYSVKGGAFTLLTGGSFHVYGPMGSYIHENNTMAVAVLMILPMMLYMYRFPPHPLVKKIMPWCIFLSLVAVIGSQSRGALLAIGAVGAFFWWQSKAKALTLIMFIILGSFGYLFMPQSWHDRMATITDYERDSSAMERLYAWEFSIKLANDRFTGGGGNAWSRELYAKYVPHASRPFVAHSIYFGVLGDSGWIGLGLFLAVLFLVWRQLNQVIALTRDDPDRANYNYLARMLKISMIAFMAGGAFLSLAYFDLAWHIMAITVAMTQQTKDSVEATSAPAAGRGRRTPRYSVGGRAAGR
ncbi:MAG: putative O-glycosylation ligase, exosortase A system-associated, partial [Halioglobus sp.]|nr:putative O-glycosylation ligase, exosortase A system-associated [Halioglobus sp.]